MTIIVGVENGIRGAIIAADTAGASGWDTTLRRDPKTYRVTQHIAIGFTTSYRMGQALGFGLGDALKEHAAPPSAQSDLLVWCVRCLVPAARKVLADAGYTKTENGRDEAGQWIAAIGRHIVCIDNDFQVALPSRSFHAIGCGAAYALGALLIADERHAGSELAQIGVEAAIEFSNGCGGHTTTIQVEAVAS